MINPAIKQVSGSHVSGDTSYKSLNRNHFLSPKWRFGLVSTMITVRTHLKYVGEIACAL